MAHYTHVIEAWTGTSRSTMPMVREHKSGDRHDDSKPSDLLIDEGETVEVLEISGPWIRIATADGHDGWIPASAVRQRAE